MLPPELPDVWVHRISDLLKAEDSCKTLFALLLKLPQEKSAVEYAQVADALHWAGVAQRMLVALRDYFSDEPTAPDAGQWRKQLVELVGEDEPQAPTPA